jgi:hypothetical protein
MHVNFYNHTQHAPVPFASKFAAWRRKLTPQQIAAIEAYLDSIIVGDRIHTAGWVPGPDWSKPTDPNHALEPIWCVACNHSVIEAAKCFGLFFWDAIDRHPDTWTSEHFEKDGVPIRSRTYFKI